MSREAMRKAIESGDLCELGRLYANELAQMRPDNPYGGGGDGFGCRQLTATKSADDSHGSGTNHASTPNTPPRLQAFPRREQAGLGDSHGEKK